MHVAWHQKMLISYLLPNLSLTKQLQFNLCYESWLTESQLNFSNSLPHTHKHTRNFFYQKYQSNIKKFIIGDIGFIVKSQNPFENIIDRKSLRKIATVNFLISNNNTTQPTQVEMQILRWHAVKWPILHGDWSKSRLLLVFLFHFQMFFLCMSVCLNGEKKKTTTNHGILWLQKLEHKPKPQTKMLL